MHHGSGRARQHGKRWVRLAPGWVVVVAVLAAVLPLSAGLAAEDDDGGGTVRIGLHAAEKNLNPFITPMALPITHDFTMLVYDTLFWSQARLDPEPWLATGAEPSDDFRTWTVQLRDGVTWHDGEAFTAEDVAFTFEYFATIGGPGRYGHHVYDHPIFASAEVLDDTTVALTFEEPIQTFELVPGGDLPILPEHVWADVEDPSGDATTLPVGTGPYEMTELEPDSAYRLEANEGYFKGAPTVDVLELTVVRDLQAAFAALQGGELDFVTRNVPAPLVEQMEQDPDLTMIEGTRLQSTYLMFNTRKPTLDDPQVRKAMSLALDLDRMVEIIEGGLARPGNDTWTHPDSPWAHPEGGHEHDVDAANAMLDESGYAREGDGSTRTTPDGEPMAFDLLVNATAPPQVRAGELVAEQLAEIGVDVTVQALDPPAISAARQPGGPDDPPTVDMFIAVFETHAHADPDHLFFFFHTPGRGVGAVFSGWSNAEFDALVEESLSAPIDRKQELIHQAQEIFAAEAPAVTLLYPDGRWAYRHAAYDGWISDPGHGVFTKRSFLPEYAGAAGAAGDADEESTGTETAEPTATDGMADEAATDAADDAAADADDTGGSGLLVALVVLGALVVVVAGVLITRRRRSGTVTD